MPNKGEKGKHEIEKTKPYKIEKAKSKKKTKNGPKVKKSKKQNQKEKVKKHPKLMLAIKIFIILFLLICVVGAGIIAGMFFGLFGDDFEITKEELKIGAANSVIVDKNGNKIADLSGDEKRKIITLEEMSDYLPKAYVAIEDERFYKHDGVDFKRTAGAIVTTVFGNSSYGGSTITQQLVKNITKDDEQSGMAGIMRKVKEWAKAYQVERMISKDQILELYLNILYIGGEGNLHGVELGAQYYFNKSAKDLDLAECAFLAGINSLPNYYNPYNLYSQNDTEEKRTERIKNKTKTVLSKMKELGYIENEEDYNNAVAKVDSGLTFAKGNVNASSGYTYHTEAVINQVIEQVMNEKGISRELAENYVYSSGLTIYSTVDTNIQNTLDEEFKKSKYIISGKQKKDGQLINDHSQAGMAVVDYKTGNVLGVAGGLGEKTETRGLNRATQSVRQCGSSMKPISVIAPALQEKVITAATAYDDCATQFGTNYKPKNYNRFTGITNIRRFIATSQNIPALKIMAELTPAKSIEYLNKMGIKSIKATEDNDIPLALGGTTNGATPLEMASAYGTIANDGVYITPTFYTKVTDSDGNTIMTPNQETTRVLSEQNAYITKTITQEPVKSGGTATYCAISGIDVAAKTGTTDKDYDRWLCGFTPYYSAACWYGYDTNEEVKYSGNPAGLIWDAVMTNIHKGLANASFVRPAGIVDATVCRTTGCLATDSCKDTYKEMFTSDNMPTKCEGHGSQEICKETGKVANEYCPEKETITFGGVLPKEKLTLWKNLSPTSTTKDKVEEVCTTHKKPEEKPKEPEKSKEPEKPKEPKNTVNNNTAVDNKVKNNTVNKNNVNTNNAAAGNKKPNNNQAGNTNAKNN